MGRRDQANFLALGFLGVDGQSSKLEVHFYATLLELLFR
jgi:hypothetical protein